jgi:cell division protease FtsH
MDKQQTFSIWYVVAAMILMITLQAWLGASHTVTLTYSEFKQALAAGSLADVVIADGQASGRLKTERLEAILPKTRSRR